MLAPTSGLGGRYDSDRPAFGFQPPPIFLLAKHRRPTRGTASPWLRRLARSPQDLRITNCEIAADAGRNCAAHRQRMRKMFLAQSSGQRGIFGENLAHGGRVGYCSLALSGGRFHMQASMMWSDVARLFFLDRLRLIRRRGRIVHRFGKEPALWRAQRPRKSLLRTQFIGKGRIGKLLDCENPVDLTQARVATRDLRLGEMFAASPPSPFQAIVS